MYRCFNTVSPVNVMKLKAQRLCDIAFLEFVLTMCCRGEFGLSCYTAYLGCFETV